MADRFEKPSDLAVSAFFQDHSVPLIGTAALAVAPHAFEASRFAVQVDSLKKLSFFGGIQSTADAGDVLALKAISGVHQLIRKIARVGEQQQPRAIEVEATNRHPTSGWQAFEHRAPATRVTARDELAYRLVIQQDPRLSSACALNRLTVDGNEVIGRSSLP